MYVKAILRGGKKVAYFRECTITCGSFTEKCGCELVTDKRYATVFTDKEAEEIMERKDFNLSHPDVIDIMVEG